MRRRLRKAARESRPSDGGTIESDLAIRYRCAMRCRLTDHDFRIPLIIYVFCDAIVSLNRLDTCQLIDELFLINQRPGFPN